MSEPRATQGAIDPGVVALGVRSSRRKEEHNVTRHFAQWKERWFGLDTATGVLVVHASAAATDAAALRIPLRQLAYSMHAYAPDGIILLLTCTGSAGSGRGSGGGGGGGGGGGLSGKTPQPADDASSPFPPSPGSPPAPAPQVDSEPSPILPALSVPPPAAKAAIADSDALRGDLELQVRAYSPVRGSSPEPLPICLHLHLHLNPYNLYNKVRMESETDLASWRRALAAALQQTHAACDAAVEVRVIGAPG